MKTQLLKPKTLPSVSVIIPTYNHREYILRAVKSSLSQHIPKIEVIVVDDASTDGTYDLLARTYKANRKVRIIRHHVNGKLGAARNTGLSHAKGKYVFFLDADDWLEKGALHTLLSVAVRYGADVVSCGVNKVWPDGRKEFFHGHGFSCTDKEDALSHLAEYSIGSIAWNKLYLRDLLEKNKIRFTTPYWHEDVLFTMKCIYRCRKYISIPNPFYNYLQRTTSIVNGRQTVLHLRSYIRLILDTVRFAKDNGIPGNGEIDGLTLRLLKSHSFTDLRSNLIRYKNSRKKTEWQDDVFEACSLEMGMWGRVVASGIISVFDQMEFSAPAVHPGNQVFTRSETRLVNMVRKIKHAVIPASSKRKRIFDLTKKALKRFVRRGQSSHPLL